MPSEMVKRIAEEAKAQAACLNDWEAEGVARAAIEAMREPTAAMANAPLEAMPEHKNWLNARASYFVWQAMIDAALKPEAGK